VMLCVNMQTSFMHPPFGFALFYLRGIADTLHKNGSLPRKVESKDIYLGSIPFIFLQLILVAVVIFIPQSVTVFLDKEQVLDINKAGDDIQKMGGGRGYGKETAAQDAAKAGATDAMSDLKAEPKAAGKDEDPMEAVKRALEADKKK
jgi:Tripartite ATP-independent periplasmic transporter, DctM component